MVELRREAEGGGVCYAIVIQFASGEDDRSVVRPGEHISLMQSLELRWSHTDLGNKLVCVANGVWFEATGREILWPNYKRCNNLHSI